MKIILSKPNLFFFSSLQASAPVLLSLEHFPQDIVILLDTSGSMTGLRKEIAKHVVINIMDTLGEDDFVTVLTFSDETKPLVDCFTDSEGEAELVQATNENIAEFTESINNIETMEIANFTSALTAAFTLLERYRTKKVRTWLGKYKAE